MCKPETRGWPRAARLIKEVIISEEATWEQELIPSEETESFDAAKHNGVGITGLDIVDGAMAKLAATERHMQKADEQ